MSFIGSLEDGSFVRNLESKIASFSPEVIGLLRLAGLVGTVAAPQDAVAINAAVGGVEAITSALASHAAIQTVASTTLTQVVANLQANGNQEAANQVQGVVNTIAQTAPAIDTVLTGVQSVVKSA